ncbi:hypothetical protein J6590_011528 [Homalodisca vitripennis]|nr:hypothetical protein J6590_011528 [Homalodisca vitripennis]
MSVRLHCYNSGGRWCVADTEMTVSLLSTPYAEFCQPRSLHVTVQIGGVQVLALKSRALRALVLITIAESTDTARTVLARPVAHACHADRSAHAVSAWEALVLITNCRVYRYGTHCSRSACSTSCHADRSAFPAVSAWGSCVDKIAESTDTARTVLARPVAHACHADRSAFV